MPGGDDRTEKATPKRRDEAKQRGQVGRSSDLNGAGVLIAGFAAVSIMGPKLLGTMADTMTSSFAHIARPQDAVSSSGMHSLLMLSAMTVLKTVGPVAGACMLAGIALNLMQVGIRFTPTALKPKFSAISPVTGFKNLFSPRTSFDLIKDLVKVAVVGGLVAIALIPDITHLGASVGTTPYALGMLMKSGTQALAMRAVAAYLLIGLVDYAWQRYRFEKGIKMTKQEVKDENKQRDLPPEVKRALRRRQFQQARARMMAAVPRADVVVTNPTHYAVALEYDGERPAPVVVAKGKGHVAAQIRRIAGENGVPLVPNPPLARELYRSVELDQMIPADLYAAVAQVLAFVYRMAARKKVGV